MNTCGTCRFFGKKEDGTNFEDDQYLSDLPDTHRRCGFITHSTYKTSDIEKQPYPKAFVVDGSDYFAALCVSTDFGCPDWSTK
jgi:hypothetical protein